MIEEVEAGSHRPTPAGRSSDLYVAYRKAVGG